MQAIFGADGERREARRSCDGLGGALVDADVALRHALSVRGLHAAEVGVDGEVTALVAVIEAGEDGEVVLMRRQWLEELRQIVAATRFRGPERGLIEAERVSNAHHAQWART